MSESGDAGGCKLEFFFTLLPPVGIFFTLGSLAALKLNNWTLVFQFSLPNQARSRKVLYCLIFVLFSDLTGDAVFLRTLYVCEFTEKSWKHQLCKIVAFDLVRFPNPLAFGSQGI